MAGPKTLMLLGAILLILGLVSSLAATRSSIEEAGGRGVVYSGEVLTLESIVGVPRGYYIVNGSIVLRNLGNATAIAFVGTLAEPVVVEIPSGSSTSLDVGPGYSISLHGRDGDTVVEVEFRGWIEKQPGVASIILTLVLFAAGSIASTLGVVTYILYHMERGGKP